MRKVWTLSVLLPCLSVALLYAAPASGWAASTAESSSSAPVITCFEVHRGSTASPEGIVSYSQRGKVLVTDPEGAADIASVRVTDPAGNDHDASRVCDDPLAFCWASWGEPTASPAGTYMATVTDWEGHGASTAARVSPLPDSPGLVPVIETPAPNYSVATALPEFSWSVPLGEGCYCLLMSEVDGACAVWCPGKVSSPLAYSGSELIPGHLYDWGISSFTPDNITQTDPAASSLFLWVGLARFWVEPKFVGFLQPIDDDGSSIFKLGSTVPVKFQLLMADGSQLTTTDCRLSLAKLEDSVTGTYQEAVSTSAPDSGEAFRYVSDHYQFSLGTRDLSPGTWRLQVRANGSVLHEAVISLK